MLDKIDFYYFSPTGGTRKIGEILAKAISIKVNMYDLGKRENLESEISGDFVLVAVPVFSGRIPSIAAEKLKSMNGNGKKAVTLVVYGTRAYEDALLELNDVMKIAGFQIVASGAFVAQHSIVAEVGAGRPDKNDTIELKEFGEKILEKLKSVEKEILVPGNYPYRQISPSLVTPISLDGCNMCEKCIDICPSGAIKIESDKLVTDINKCILCMACVHNCPNKARILPPLLQEQMNNKLGSFKDIRRENEIYI